MVIDSENGYVRWMNVLNDNSVIEKLDITEALLERLALEKWIHVVSFKNWTFIVKFMTLLLWFCFRSTAMYS